MDIKAFLDLDMLQKIQDLFSDATGLAAIAVDSQGNYITKGSNFTDFCMKYTRGVEEGQRRCVKCDNEGAGTYFCHAGLMDFASDIIVEGEKVGAIIGGQVLPGTPDLEHIRQIARELGINEDRYIEAVQAVPVRSEKMIRSAANLLSLFVNQLVNLEYLRKLNSKKIDVFDKEIEGSLEEIKKIQAMTRDLQQVATMERILALNASVEAAHAGKAGLGFSVVAEEIGNLSRRSSNVYQEIFDLVGSVQESITNMSTVKV